MFGQFVLGCERLQLYRYNNYFNDTIVSLKNICRNITKKTYFTKTYYIVLIPTNNIVSHLHKNTKMTSHLNSFFPQGP